MKLTIFDNDIEILQSTSPVPGKLAASLTMANQSALPDAFVWDPMSGIIQYDEQVVMNLLGMLRKAKGGIVSIVLMISDGLIAVVKWIRRLFGGNYGGSMGYGQAGSIVAAASAILLIMISIAAAVIILPLSIVAWVVRKKVEIEVKAEKKRLLDEVSNFFVGLQSS